MASAGESVSTSKHKRDGQRELQEEVGKSKKRRQTTNHMHHKFSSEKFSWVL